MCVHDHGAPTSWLQEHAINYKHVNTITVFMPMDIFRHPFERQDIRNWICMSTKTDVHILRGSTGSLSLSF